MRVRVKVSAMVRVRVMRVESIDVSTLVTPSMVRIVLCMPLSLDFCDLLQRLVLTDFIPSGLPLPVPVRRLIAS